MVTPPRISGREPVRTGRRHHSIAPYGTFQLDDGSTVLIAIQNEREWERLARVVLNDDALATDPAFAGNARRFANVDRLEELMSRSLLRLPAAEMRALLAYIDSLSVAGNRYVAAKP